MEDLPEHVLQVRLRVEPAGDGVTEEDEVRDNSSGVHADHLTHPPERGVLLVVVSDVPETSAPRPHKLLETWSDNSGTYKAHPANRDRCVFQQSFRSVWPVDDGDQRVEDGWDVAGHVVAQLDRDLARRPGGVVAHADVLRVQVARKDRHELWYARVDVRETRLGEVAQQSKT